MMTVVGFPPLQVLPLLLSRPCSHSLPTGPWKPGLYIQDFKSPIETHQRLPQRQGRQQALLPCSP